jgi:hypothetical protein
MLQQVKPPRHALRDLLTRRGPMAEKQNKGIQNEKRVHQSFAGLACLADWGHGHDGLSGAASVARASCFTSCGAQASFAFRVHCFFRSVVPGGRAPATGAATSLLRKRARRYRSSTFLP